jgi:serine/threonine protein kinase
LVVAVKVIRGDSCVGEGQAINEARIGAKLDHRNLLRIFEAQKVGAFWVVVIEFLQGDDLSRVDLPPSVIRPFFGQLADAIQAMARARIVHRDIKPANIIRRRADGAPVLIDFGLAVDLDATTKHPGFAGTPLFMAPESFLDAWPDSSQDAYSLGVTAVVLLAKDQLPRNVHFNELIQMKVQGAFDRRLAGALSQVKDDVLRSWCAALLSEPANRLSQLEEARSWVDQQQVAT